MPAIFANKKHKQTTSNMLTDTRICGRKGLMCFKKSACMYTKVNSDLIHATSVQVNGIRTSHKSPASASLY